MYYSYGNEIVLAGSYPKKDIERGKKMKFKNLVMSSIVLGSLMGATTTALAAEYDPENPDKAQTSATINFIADEEPEQPVDPEDPDNPIDPVDPINPNGGELMITYASKFDFGSQTKSGTTWNALADNLKDGTKVVPFVGTKDSRGTDRKGWVLTAKQDGAFKDSQGNELTGAELTLSNLSYTDKEGAPTAKAGTVTLSTTPEEIASAGSNQGIGSWSVALGSLQGEAGSETTNGVTLSVPGTTAKNTDTYSTTVTWELTADPGVGE